MRELMLQYYFEDRFDLVQFARVVKDAGLYLMLRIGPFVAAEWNFGSVYCPCLGVILYVYWHFVSFLWCNKIVQFVCEGFRGVPVWLHYIPGTVFRTNNEPFKVGVPREFCSVFFGKFADLGDTKYMIPSDTLFWMQFHMKTFTTKIVDMMKKERFFASQGGHIILSQVVISDSLEADVQSQLAGLDDLNLNFVLSRLKTSMEIMNKRMELAARRMQRGQPVWLWL
jgi:hypothetical protein